VEREKEKSKKVLRKGEIGDGSQIPLSYDRSVWDTGQQWVSAIREGDSRGDRVQRQFERVPKPLKHLVLYRDVNSFP
jgi:hypothetical protein